MSKASATLGGLVKDGNGQSIQIGGQFVTQDATGTPQTSPISYSSTTIYPIVVPDTAIEMIIMPTTDLRVSEKSDVSRYDLVKANSKECFPVARMQTVYIQESAADGSAYVRFTTI